MQTKTKFIIFIVAVIIIVGGIGIYFATKPAPPSKLDGFAQCLKSSGALFYGAFWCPHCQEQKAEFGTSAEYLPYVECSKPDNSQTQICIDKKITGYPTWIFKDGTTLEGKQSLDTLAQKTGCTLPQ
jgi:thiol-disulfide isomerase/thioredoxin